MHTDSRPRVVIIDDDARLVRDLEDILKLRRMEVRGIILSHSVPVNQAVKIAREFRPHVAIIDLRLRDENVDDRSGMDLLTQLGAPHSFLYSSYLSPSVMRTAQAGSESLQVVSKYESPDALVRALSDVSKRLCASRGRRLEFHDDALCEDILHATLGSETDMPLSGINDILVQLFPGTDRLVVTPVTMGDASVQSTFRQNSALVTVRSGDRPPVIVKFAPAEDTKREARRYAQYIRGRLGGHFYSELERFVIFWDLGAGIYRTVGSPTSPLLTYSEFFLKESGPTTLIQPIRHLFTHVWLDHYAHIQSSERSLLEFHDAVSNLTPQLSGADIQQEIAAFLAELPEALLEPASWFLEQKKSGIPKNVRTVVGHGNLHADNILVSGEHAWVIDFGSTGRVHRLKDFVTLEVDIVTRLTGALEDDFTGFLNFVSMLLKPQLERESAPNGATPLYNDEAAKAIDVISSVRRLAVEATGMITIQEYLWSLLMESLNVVLNTPSTSSTWKKAVLLSSMLCSRIALADDAR